MTRIDMSKVLSLLDSGALASCMRTKRNQVHLLQALHSECFDPAHPLIDDYMAAEWLPSDMMPRWMAYVSVYIDAATPEAKWAETIRRYADVASRWHCLSEEAWRVLEMDLRAMCVTHALHARAVKCSRLTEWPAIEAACLDVADALQRHTWPSDEVVAKVARQFKSAARRFAEWACPSPLAWSTAATLAAVARRAGGDAGPRAIKLAATSADTPDTLIPAMLDKIETAVAAGSL